MRKARFETAPTSLVIGRNDQYGSRSWQVCAVSTAALRISCCCSVWTPCQITGPGGGERAWDLLFSQLIRQRHGNLRDRRCWFPICANALVSSFPPLYLVTYWSDLFDEHGIDPIRVLLCLAIAVVLS